MNANKTGQLLRKINKLFENISSEPGEISLIERDLLLQYLRQAYEAASEDGNEVRATPVDQKSETARDTERSKANKTEEAVPVKSIAGEEQKEEKAAGEPQQEADHSEAEDVREEEPPADENGSENGKGETDIPPEIQKLFEQREAVEISDRLSQTPISDLKQSMSINERIQATYELFGGDDRSFQNALQKIDELDTYGEARDYLLENWALSGEWGKPGRRSTAAHFIHLVYRKFK